MDPYLILNICRKILVIILFISIFVILITPFIFAIINKNKYKTQTRVEIKKEEYLDSTEKRVVNINGQRVVMDPKGLGIFN